MVRIRLFAHIQEEYTVTAEGAELGKTQLDASRREKKGCSMYRDTREATEPLWGGVRRVCYGTSGDLSYKYKDTNGERTK